MSLHTDMNRTKRGGRVMDHPWSRADLIDLTTFAQQPTSYTLIANPVSGTEYEWRAGLTGAGAALGAQANVRILNVWVSVDWTVLPSPLEVHIYIDGNVETHTFANPVTGTVYQTNIELLGWGSEDSPLSAGAMGEYRAFLDEGKSIRITAETTGGTVSALRLQVKWAQKA